MNVLPDKAKIMAPAITMVLALFLVIAVSRNFEKATTPGALGPLVHVYLRKALSVLAFGAAGFAIAHLRRRGTKDVFTIALLVAAYSALIEVAQYMHGEREGLYWNTIDTLCGFIGGFLGSWAYAMARRARRTRLAP